MQAGLSPFNPLALQFTVTNRLLLLFLFPTFYTLSSLLEEGHTLGIVDTVILMGNFLFPIVLPATRGAVSAG